jgi:hypothetical protein
LQAAGLIGLEGLAAGPPAHGWRSPSPLLPLVQYLTFCFPQLLLLEKPLAFQCVEAAADEPLVIRFSFECLFFERLKLDKGCSRC